MNDMFNMSENEFLKSKINFLIEKISIYEELDANSKAFKILIDKLLCSNPTNINIEDAKGIIIHRGLPDEFIMCCECKKYLNNLHYNYYNNRVDDNGYLIRINNKCLNCS